MIDSREALQSASLPFVRLRPSKLKHHWLYACMIKSISIFMWAAALCLAPAVHADAPGQKAVKKSSTSAEHEPTLDELLTGTWVSEDTSGGALRGTMILRANKTVTLHPMPIGDFEFPTFEGTWKANAVTIRISVPTKGESELYFAMTDKDTLKVLYENGTSQAFRRDMSLKPLAKEPKK